MKRTISFVLVLSMILSVIYPALCFGQEDSQKEETVSYYGLNDPAFVSDLQGACYDAFKDGEEDGGYTVEDVQAAYVSKEYLEELSYNELLNIYFGYTLEEAEALAQGERWQFTLSEDGRTTVEAIEKPDEEIEWFQERLTEEPGVVLLHVVIKTIRGKIDLVFKMLIDNRILRIIIEEIVDFLLATIDYYLDDPAEGWKTAFQKSITELAEYVDMIGLISEQFSDVNVISNPNVNLSS